MPNPIPAVIDYRVERVYDKRILEDWKLTGSEPALFLCRITRIGQQVIDSTPVAVFARDSEGQRFDFEFLKHERVT